MASTARVRAVSPDISRRVGYNIRKIRKQRGIFRPDLSWLMHEAGYDISEAVLKNIEGGYPGKTTSTGKKPRWITVDELYAFAEVLDVSIEELFSEPVPEEEMTG